MKKDFAIYKETRCTGCEMEDGSNNSKVEIKFVFVARDYEEAYSDWCAEEYGNQDYSYQFSTVLILDLFWYEVPEFKKIFKEIEVYENEYGLIQNGT